ncbi:MAG: O-antigen ligase family protein [Clostridia bacterium]|nr:O-antigen ligase family protein [Clostridia bacterium]
MFSESFTGRALCQIKNAVLSSMAFHYITVILNFVALLFKWVEYSAIYHFIFKIVKYFADKTKSSITYQLLQNTTKIDIYVKHSKILKFFDKISVSCLSGLEKIYKNIRKINLGSINNTVFEYFHRSGYFRYELLVGYAFLITFVVPHDFWNNIYGLGIAVILFALYVVVLLSGRNFSYRISELNIGLLIFMFMTAVSVFISYAPRDSFRVFLFFITAYIFMFVISGSIKEENTLHKFLGLVYLTVQITAVICIIQGIIGVEADAVLTDMTTNEGLPGRAFSTLENPNNYAEFLVMFFPFCWAFSLNIDNKGKRKAALCGLALPVIAIALTYSRSGWVSIALGVLTLIIFYDIKYLPYLIMAGIAAIPFLPQSIMQRLLTLGSMEDTSNAYRVYIWNGTIDMMKDFWLRGIGMGTKTFQKLYPLYSDYWSKLAPHSHMLFLQVLAETGIIGVVAFLWFWVDFIKKSVTIYIKNKVTPKMKNVIIAGIASLIGLIFISGVEYIWFYPRNLTAFFCVIGIMSASIRICKYTPEKKKGKL